MALAYVGVATLLVVAHAEDEPNCRRPGHPHACATEATLEKALSRMPPHLSGTSLEVAYRDTLLEALALWQARVAPQASAMVHSQEACLSPYPASAAVSDPLPE